MFTMTGKTENISHRQPNEPVEHHATPIQFDEGLPEAACGTSVCVEIYRKGADWFCHVRRGAERTQALGPYSSKQQAERIQDLRRSLLAKRGISMLTFITD